MWKVRYLIHYNDMDRWGESKAFGRENAFKWVHLVSQSVLEVHIYMSEKCIASFKRDARGDMRRVMMVA